MQITKRLFRRCGRLPWAIAVLPLWATFLAGSLPGAAFTYTLTGLGGNSYEYQFFPSGLDLLTNQEFDIAFDFHLYGSLLNGTAGSDFQLGLLQPDNPPGADGHYSALALLDHPSLSGPFAVDVTWIGSGDPRTVVAASGGLPYVLHQFDANGRITGTIGSGFVSDVPEPAAWLLSGIGLALGVFSKTVRHRP